MANIQLDFGLARRQADALEEAAGQLHRMADAQFQNAMQGLSAHWKGQSAAAYLQKCELMRERLHEEARNIEKIAGSLRRRISILYQAEQEAKHIAATRSGG